MLTYFLVTDVEGAYPCIYMLYAYGINVLIFVMLCHLQNGIYSLTALQIEYSIHTGW